MRQKVIVADTDERYARKLAQILRSQERFAAGIQVITQPGLLEKYMQTHTVDWIFLTREFISDALMDEMAGCITILVDTPDPLDSTSVAKYQPADRLVPQLLDSLPGQLMISKKEVVTVLSPDSREAGTMLALSLAVTLGVQGRVLYLELDPFSPLKELIPFAQAPDVSDEMFYFRQGIGISEQSTPLLQWKGMTVLGPPGHTEDLEDLRQMEPGLFLEFLQQGSSADWMICHLGDSVAQAAELLPVSRHLYLAEKKDPWCRSRCSQIYQYLQDLYEEDLGHQYSICSIPEVRLDHLTEEGFDQIYQTEWREFIWEHLQRNPLG